MPILAKIFCKQKLTVLYTNILLYKILIFVHLSKFWEVFNNQFSTYPKNASYLCLESCNSLLEELRINKRTKILDFIWWQVIRNYTRAAHIEEELNNNIEQHLVTLQGYDKGEHHKIRNCYRLWGQQFCLIKTQTLF